MSTVSDTSPATAEEGRLPGHVTVQHQQVGREQGRRGRGDGAAIRREFDLGRAPVLGCVARLAPRRGHELLIRGFQLLLAEYPQSRLLLVGKGEARDRLGALVAELGLAHQVLFTGYRDADLPGVLHALDAFALMGAGSDESCRAALEAMAAGRWWRGESAQARAESGRCCHA